MKVDEVYYIVKGDGFSETLEERITPYQKECRILWQKTLNTSSMETGKN
ncbi:hypothetical protein DYY67_0581 [Candidatus Nitrosotalea sp. TS]|nr:hypothetical protein [Candidatus Nitrosotalea sp. TS]NHI02542.1 hypothetical protein [Candidatus Nitrosotalea sp. TS]